MTDDLLNAQAETVRGFNRFYTRQIGVLDEGLLASPFTLTQARVLFELGIRKAVTAREIGDVLGLDAGYLSRIVQNFASQGLIRREPSPEDGRQIVLSLTTEGRKTFRGLDRKSHAVAAAHLSGLSTPRRARVLSLMQDLQHALSPEPGDGTLTIRTYRAGDIGWAIERHARIYTDEFGWNQDFEALVATLFARFATQHDPATERCWIAEVDGERVGCVFVVRNEEHPNTAQLRCLLVDPKARGLGIGKRLVDECLAFARAAGYTRMLLWTNDILTSARRIYEAAGFELVKEERHHSFGHDLVGQIWRRDL